ncbi:hypothetical protein [Rhizobium sp. BK602]|uniref:hypothetical protein n=1 Tax=Rhizobium sp. BK602 TaxID=2586986 RepID=UPI00160AF151|nr:hypothetical protein [Rhizobium sp. BK602]MBB3608650.1 hypothetical protein [Rhizobium sp. BK602]
MSIETGWWWLPLLLTALVFLLALANLGPGRGAISALRNGALFAAAVVASAAVWLMWAMVL